MPISAPQPAPRTYLYDSLDRLIYAGAVTSTGFIEDRYYTYDNLGDIITARLKLPSAIPARGDFATGLTSSSATYATRGSFNPLTATSLSTTANRGSAMLPFDFGFRAPAAGGAGTDTTLTYGYGANGAIPHAVTSRSNGDAFSYDANGNMTTRTMGGVTWTQTFDAENHLVTVSNGTTTTTYVYDADGNRVTRKVEASGSPTVTMLYVAGMEVETTGSDTKTTVYYSAGGAFRVIGGSGAGLYFRLTDNLGSTSLVTKADGAEQPNSRVVYAPFGEVRSGQQSTLTDFGYTGQRHDDTDGLMYYNARYYLPGIQHFISADTITSGASTSQSLNRYAYVSNNPIKNTDPTGHIVPSGCAAGDCGYYDSTIPYCALYGNAPECRPKNTRSAEGEEYDSQPKPHIQTYAPALPWWRVHEGKGSVTDFKITYEAWVRETTGGYTASKDWDGYCAYTGRCDPNAYRGTEVYMGSVPNFNEWAFNLHGTTFNIDNNKILTGPSAGMDSNNFDVNAFAADSIHTTGMVGAPGPASWEPGLVAGQSGGDGGAGGWGALLSGLTTGIQAAQRENQPALEAWKFHITDLPDSWYFGDPQLQVCYSDGTY